MAVSQQVHIFLQHSCQMCWKGFVVTPPKLHIRGNTNAAIPFLALQKCCVRTYSSFLFRNTQWKHWYFSQKNSSLFKQLLTPPTPHQGKKIIYFSLSFSCLDTTSPQRSFLRHFISLGRETFPGIVRPFVAIPSRLMKQGRSLFSNWGLMAKAFSELSCNAGLLALPYPGNA